MADAGFVAFISLSAHAPATMVLPLREISVLDRNAEAIGVTTRTLMEHAGEAVARHVRERSPDGPVVVLSGAGNNGGDGLVAARHLTEGAGEAEVEVAVATPVEAGRFKTRLAHRAYQDLPGSVELHQGADGPVAQDLLGDAAVAVDALLGAGIRGEPRGTYGEMVHALNDTPAHVVSVDVPTGLGTGLAVEPDATVTFHDVKEGMSEGNSGTIHVADIGIPTRAVTHTGPGELELYPRPDAAQHKGQGGFVLVIGGGPYHGAPVLCGLAAMRTGADLSIVLTPEKAAPAVQASSPNLVVRSLRGEDLDFEDPQNRVTLNLWMEKADSVVIGPGLGRFNVTKQSIHHAVERASRSSTPLVVDADALWAMGDHPELLGSHVVVTPHANEFRELTGETAPSDPEARGELAAGFSRDTGATVLFKGPVDVVARGDGLRYNDTGTPAMSVGGTGDVLAGCVGALLAKGLDPFAAARVAAYLSGRAGEHAFREIGYGLLASDVVDAVPAVLQEHLLA